MKKPKSRAAIITVLLLSLLIFGGVFEAWTIVTDILLQPANSGNKNTVTITIPPNATTADIADQLQSKGLIRNALAFRIWARIKGLDTRLQAGVYKSLSPSMTTSKIIDMLLDGQPDAVPVTVPEGWRLEQIANAINARKPQIAKFDKAKFLDYTKNIDHFPNKSKHPLLQQVPKEYHNMEGLLFPDTYEVPIVATTEEVIDQMLSEMEGIIKENNFEQKAKDLKYKNVYELLIMASIVERETGKDDYRGGIASVYWNRIFRRNDETVQLLNADPTIQYARDTNHPPTKYWEPLVGTPSEIEPTSLWNTYNKPGITPTPICSPGLLSLKAAADPPHSDNYFFFAATDGKTYFAKTKAEFDQLMNEHTVNQ